MGATVADADLPEHAQIPVSAAERLAYAGLRTADEVQDLSRRLASLEATAKPCLDEYALLLGKRRAESEAAAGFRAELWRGLSQRYVIAAIITALLGGLGLGGASDRMISAAEAALAALSGPTTSIEVRDAH